MSLARAQEIAATQPLPRHPHPKAVRTGGMTLTDLHHKGNFFSKQHVTPHRTHFNFLRVHFPHCFWILAAGCNPFLSSVVGMCFPVQSALRATNAEKADLVHALLQLLHTSASAEHSNPAQVQSECGAQNPSDPRAQLRSHRCTPRPAQLTSRSDY